MRERKKATVEEQCRRVGEGMREEGTEKWKRRKSSGREGSQSMKATKSNIKWTLKTTSKFKAN